MDHLTLSFLFPLLLALVHYAFTVFGRRNSRLPPGPFPLPIIGNLLHLSDKPHQTLAALAKHYGPLMSLKFGSRTSIVVSSPEIAKDFFQTHDHSFSGRPIPDSVRVVDHDNYSLVWLPAGDQWRRLRKISKEYLFSVQRLDASEIIRQQKIRDLLDYVNRRSARGKAVNVGAIAFTTSLNALSNLMFSMDSAQYDSVTSQVSALLEVGGKPNIADFFPMLKPFDPQGIRRHSYVCIKKILTIIDGIINQRLQARLDSPLHNSVTPKNDVLDLLLNINRRDESEVSRKDITHLFLELFIAGIDTTSSTIEWAMVELIHRPHILEKARSEVIKVMENKTNILQESDIARLPYLQAVIKETLRLHPPIPFLVPHEAIQDVEIQGFLVPKNAQILCNVWAMGRDPKIWSHPEKFMPERFLEGKIDYKGQSFELIPFGAGRRSCPGINIAHRMLHMMLGTLIREFDWKLDGNMRAQDMDMEEKFGLTLQRKLPLIAFPLRFK